MPISSMNPITSTLGSAAHAGINAAGGAAAAVNSAALNKNQQEQLASSAGGGETLNATLESMKQTDKTGAAMVRANTAAATAKLQNDTAAGIQEMLRDSASKQISAGNSGSKAIQF